MTFIQIKAKETDDQAWCFIGTVALPPKDHLECRRPNEIFACAHGEARCDGLGYCGTGICAWR